MDNPKESSSDTKEEKKPFIFEFDGRRWKSPIKGTGELWGVPEILYVTPNKNVIRPLLEFELLDLTEESLSLSCGLFLTLKNDWKYMITTNCVQEYGTWIYILKLSSSLDTAKDRIKYIAEEQMKLQRMLVAHDSRLATIINQK